MSAKFTKNQKVVRFTKWSEYGCECVYEFFTVKSCGKKQMTLEKENNGEMLNTFVYAGDTVGGYPSVFLASDFATIDEVIAKAVEFSAVFRQAAIDMHNDRLTRWPDSSAGYLKAMQSGLEKVTATAPSALSRNEALATLKIKPEVPK